MPDLILKVDPNSDGGEFYLVHHDGKVVGRIFNRLPGASAPRDATWFWGLSVPPGWRQPLYGNAVTREAAMVAFRARWDAGEDPMPTDPVELVEWGRRNIQPDQ